MIEPVTHAVGLCLIAFIAAAAAWPARRLNGWSRAAALAPPLGVTIAAPFFAPDGPVWLRAAVVLTCPVVGIKLVDLHVGAAHWRTRRLGNWLRFLALHVVLVYRVFVRQPARPTGESLRLLVRGALEIAAGAVILVWAFDRELEPFWLEHTVKAAGIYLCVLDGLFVFMTGLLRLLGCPIADQSRHPILAATPADFWRRYNMEAGRFLHEDVFKPLGGGRRPVLGIMAVFLVNGVIHECLAALMIGRVLGYQVAMFAIFGAATAATWRWRPEGVWRVAGVVLTGVFMLVVSVLFFGTADRFVDWYSGPGPLP